MSGTMRDRFYGTAEELVDADERIAVVLADIGTGRMPDAERAHADRVINVGIREQLMVGVAAGLAMTGFRPIVHSFAPFAVERPFEMLKLDLGHNDVGAIVVSVGASYDTAVYGRTHQSPEDVTLLSALPGWRIYVPGHPTEADQLLRAAARTDERVYLRLSDQSNQLARPITPGRLHLERRGRDATVIATGPLLDAALEATADLDVTVLYMTTARPFDADTLRASLTGDLVVLVEPYLAGTSSAEVAMALADEPHRIAAIGVPNVEHRKYGTWQEHNAAHGLDARGIRARPAGALAHRMKVGLQLASFTWPGGAPEIARRLEENARTAEEAGFHSLWVMDHYFQIPPWGKAEDHPMLEAYSTLGYLAAATERIRLGVLVSGVIYRPPAVLIKAATTVDVLSGGRTYFGVGAAWFKGEADALGIAFPELRDRYALLEDTLRLARQTWSGDTSPFEGKRVRAAYPLSNPRPLSSPRPKILVGGDGPKRTLPLVAKYADAWNVITSPSRIDLHRDRLRAECERIGRSFDELEVTALDPEDLRGEEIAGYEWSPRWEVRRLGEWRERGVDHVIVNIDADPAILRRFGTEVIRQIA